jgi:predicted nucleic acid-binding protein
MATPARCYVDTSALLAILNRRDVQHDAARVAWERLLSAEAELWTCNYVVLEASAILQNRAGMDGLRALHRDLLPVVRVAWVDETAHNLATAAVLAANRRGLSLVDAVSFQVMRRLGLDAAFAFDPHFGEQGFLTVP